MFVKFRIWALPLLLLIMLLPAACGRGQAEPDPLPQVEAATPAPADPDPTATPEPEPPAPEPTAPPAEEAAPEETIPEEDEAEPTAEPAEETSAETASAAAEAAATGPLTFSIDPTASTARFYIDEVLMGADKTVIGETSMVTGTVTVDPGNPAATELSTIVINARDFKTDADRRNRAIQRQVLQSANDDYQFITFTPTEIQGLPDAAAVGETLTFTVVGDLTIRDTTRSEAFDVTLTADSLNELSGLGTTTVLYADYGIRIPSVPVVASVEDEVRLEIEFVARSRQ